MVAKMGTIKNSRLKSDDRGMVDMPSLIVGVIVTAILLAVVGTISFVMIPWQQNESAKSVLVTVNAAQESVSSLSDRYLDKAGLERREALGKIPEGIELEVHALDDPFDPENAGSIPAQPAGPNYVAIVKSETGKFFYITNTTEPEQLPR